MLSPAKHTLAGEPAVRIDVERRGDQRADVDLRRLAEQHPARVDQIHPPRRVDPPVQMARIAAEHPVQRRRARRRLQELHPRIAPDAEARPVDRRRVAALVDGQRQVGLA
jgi:hypothetical protein